VRNPTQDWVKWQAVVKKGKEISGSVHFGTVVTRWGTTNFLKSVLLHGVI